MSRRNAIIGALVSGLVFFLASPRDGAGQVVAEPSMLSAGVPGTESFQAHIAFPEDGLVLGGMIRFAVARDVDIGGRAGLWFIDGADDTPYAGADVRYGLLSRALTPGGRLNLSFNVGLGVSDPGPTVWKIPVGVLTGIGLGRGGRDVEIFVHPRVELGASTGDDDTDAALLLDIGGMFPISSPLNGMIDIRFGDGIFGEGDQLVVAAAAVWRL